MPWWPPRHRVPLRPQCNSGTGGPSGIGSDAIDRVRDLRVEGSHAGHRHTERYGQRLGGFALVPDRGGHDREQGPPRPALAAPEAPRRTLQLGESVELGGVGCPRRPSTAPESAGRRSARRARGHRRAIRPRRGLEGAADRLEREPLSPGAAGRPRGGLGAPPRRPRCGHAATGWGSRPSVCRERMRRVVVSAATANWSIVISSRELETGRT